MVLLHVLCNYLPLSGTMVVQQIEQSPTGWCGVSLCVIALCVRHRTVSCRPNDVMVWTVLCTRERERIDHVWLLPALPSHPSPRLLERANAATALAARDMAGIWHLCVSSCFRSGFYAHW